MKQNQTPRAVGDFGVGWVFAFAAFALAVLFCPTPANAGAKGGFTNGDAGIITPDVATGVRSFNEFSWDVNGDLVLCAKWTRGQDGNCVTWAYPATVVPKGRAYVGFRVVSRDYGYRQIEVYWK